MPKSTAFLKISDGTNLILHSDQGFDSLEHFKAELIAYLDCDNNRRSKAKQKGLPPAIHRQQALQAA